MTAKLTIVEGDITRQEVDAIVNAANNSLLGGGGVDGAIHRAAGPQLLEACRMLDGCKTGNAKITKGYKLPARWVVHTVGPIWRETHGDEDDALLASAYRRSLEVGRASGAHTIAFPSLSTGAYRFPVDRAAAIALRTIRSFIEEHQGFDEVRMVCFNLKTFVAYKEALTELEKSA